MFFSPLSLLDWLLSPALLLSFPWCTLQLTAELNPSCSRAQACSFAARKHFTEISQAPQAASPRHPPQLQIELSLAVVPSHRTTPIGIFSSRSHIDPWADPVVCPWALSQQALLMSWRLPSPVACGAAPSPLQSSQRWDSRAPLAVSVHSHFSHPLFRLTFSAPSLSPCLPSWYLLFLEILFCLFCFIEIRISICSSGWPGTQREIHCQSEQYRLYTPLLFNFINLIILNFISFKEILF